VMASQGHQHRFPAHHHCNSPGSSRRHCRLAGICLGPGYAFHSQNSRRGE
jgi:hypothetical protein